MSPFHIQARLVKGPLHNPERDEVRRADAESREAAFRIARGLVRAGFTVWIWAKKSQPDARTDLDLIETLRPAAARIASHGHVGRPDTRAAGSAA